MNKIIVYSYITNNVNNKKWPSITYKDDNIDYVMFTDDVRNGESERDGWNVRYVPTETDKLTKEDMNKLYKWHPYDNFDGYDYSIYMDSKTRLIMNPNDIISKFKDKMKYGFITHIYDYYPIKKGLFQFRYNYEDVYKHIDYLIGVMVGNIHNLKRLKTKFEQEGFPSNSGVLECCAIISDLHNMCGKYLQDEIFKTYLSANTARDQVVVPYVLWKNGISVNEIGLLGNYCNKSIYFGHSGINVNNRNYSDDRYNRSIKKKTVVTMTSWVKRISNCIRVVDDIECNSVVPDIIYLNLSCEEFPNKEKDLPPELVERTIKYDNFIINWVDGPNNKTFKKMFPILKYLDDDDIIIVVDDDVIIPKDFIKSRLDDYKKYNSPITGGTSKDCNGSVFHDVCGIDYMKTATACSLYTKKMLNGYDILMTDSIISYYNDDIIYTVLVYLNGYIFVPCTDYSIWSDRSWNKNKIRFFNTVDALSRRPNINGDYRNTSAMLVKEIKEHLKNIEYNTFNKDRYDLFVGNTHTLHPNPHRDIKRDTNGGSKNTPSSTISKLREDIQAGRVVKIPTRNGFIWKRVK